MVDGGDYSFIKARLCTCSCSGRVSTPLISLENIEKTFQNPLYAEESLAANVDQVNYDLAASSIDDFLLSMNV